MKLNFKFVLCLTINILVIFLCFNILHHNINTVDIQHTNKYNKLVERVDSLENEFNIHKVQKDTITLNIINHEN
jgi:hypothetical protein